MQKEMSTNLMDRSNYNFAMELSKVEDRERRRFAELLHDDIGQNLVIIKMLCESVINDSHNESKNRNERIYKVISLLNRTIQTARSMTAGLYPAALEDLGLEYAVKWYIESVLDFFGIEIILNVDEKVEEVSNDFKRLMFRIIQESLQNILKHAEASTVDVQCWREAGYVKLTIKDNGKGFSVEKVKNRAGRGIGLMLMKEKTESLMGSFNLRSAPGDGTVIHVELPEKGMELDNTTIVRPEAGSRVKRKVSGRSGSLQSTSSL